MKTLWKIFLVAALMACKAAIAADYGPNHMVVISSNLVSAATANTTNSLEASLCWYHTFHVSVSGSTYTNVVMAYLDRTVDGSNWFPFSTNSLNLTAMAEVTAIGTWQQFRARTVATNALVTLNIIYQGAR